jgi:hypothetical protein
MAWLLYKNEPTTDTGSSWKENNTSRKSAMVLDFFRQAKIGRRIL